MPDTNIEKLAFYLSFANRTVLLSFLCLRLRSEINYSFLLSEMIALIVSYGAREQLCELPKSWAGVMTMQASLYFITKINKISSLRSKICSMHWLIKRKQLVISLSYNIFSTLHINWMNR